MKSLSERLDDYADLSPAEQADVDREVAAAGSPDDRQRLAEARALAALIAAAQDARPGQPVSADDVADVLADESLGLVHPDAERVHAAITSDPALRAEAERVRARLAEMHAGAEAPADQMERLVGTAAEAHAVPIAPLASRPARAADRAAAPPPRARLVSTRRVLVLAAAVVVGYGGLFALSESQRPDRMRVADLRDLADYTPPTTRGTSDADPLPARLDAALDHVVAARRTTLGLFPRVDPRALDAASAEIAAIIGEAATETEVSQEARLALARVRIAQNRDAEAVRLLGALVREQSYRAPEARRLLDFVRTQA